MRDGHGGGRLRTRTRLGLAPSVGLTLLLIGCGTDPAPPSAPAIPSPEGSGSPIPSTSAVAVSPSSGSSLVPLAEPPVLAIDDVPLMCGSPLAFGIDALEGPTGAERADHPAAERLRELIADYHAPDGPGWQVVVLGDEGALFLLWQGGEEHPYWSVEIGPAASGWSFVRMGQCDIQPAFEGVEPARWELVPGQALGPGTIAIDVEVFEMGCASGASPEGRIVGPAVIPIDDALIVIIGTTPAPGPQTCLPAPPATVRVQLPEPLGDRQLLDGSTLPAEPRS